jgi:CheY-like chemotaxis protein
MQKIFNIAIVDDQTDCRDKDLYGLLHAGQDYGLSGLTFRDVDFSPFLSHEDPPFSHASEQLIEMPEFLVEDRDYKSREGYILDPDSQYVLHVGWDGVHAVKFAQQGLDLLLINREMITLDGHKAVDNIREKGLALPIIIITGDNEGALTQFSPPVYTQPFEGHQPNVNGYVHKYWDLFRKLDATGVQALALLFPEQYGYLLKKHEEKYGGPILAPNYAELVAKAIIDRQHNMLYYMR